MRENTRRMPSSSLSGRHVLSFALLGLLLAGATFVLGLSAGRRMAQSVPVAHEKNPLLASDAKTEALAQVQLQQAQRQQALLTFQEELIKPIPIAVAVSAPKPAQEVSAPSAPTPAPAVVRQASLRDAFLEFEREGREVSKKEASAPVVKESVVASKESVVVSKESVALKEWTLQVSSHRGKEEAERIVAKLSSKGYMAYVVPVELGEKGTWHRVRVGQFASKQEADVVADKLAEDMRMSAPLVISLK